MSVLVYVWLSSVGKGAVWSGSVITYSYANISAPGGLSGDRLVPCEGKDLDVQPDETHVCLERGCLRDSVCEFYYF